MHQPSLETYKKSGKHNRSFQTSWFEYYSTWLEYSPTKDAAYCLPCFVFHNTNGVEGQNTFTVDGFRNWKKVGGKNCYFQGHIGKDPNLTHRVAEQKCKDLMNQWQYLQRVVDHFTTKQIANNRLQLKASIYIVHMVLKTKSNWSVRLVQPRTGLQSGPIMIKNQKYLKNQ